MMSDPTEEEEVGEERTRVRRMEMVMYLDAWRPRALPVAGRVIAGLLCGGDGICISNHRLTHLERKQEVVNNHKHFVKSTVSLHLFRTFSGGSEASHAT